jgi:hypothetical protein
MLVILNRNTSLIKEIDKGHVMCWQGGRYQSQKLKAPRISDYLCYCWRDWQYHAWPHFVRGFTMEKRFEQKKVLPFWGLLEGRLPQPGILSPFFGDGKPPVRSACFTVEWF